MKRWPGKRVLVTGAAAGIGRALAARLAAARAHVVLTDVDEVHLARTAGELRAAGGSVEFHALDVTDGAAVVRVREQVHAHGGPLDVLVNNAGVVHGGPFLSVPLEKHLATLAVNTAGTVAVTHAFLADLVSRPEAHLVNIASAAGFGALPFASAYAASKWAVIGFSESIRIELERLGQGHVKVTTVCPLFVSTGLFQGARPLRTAAMLEADDVAAQIVRAVEREEIFLLTPWQVRAFPVLNALIPARWVHRVSSLLGAAGSMERWIGHGPRGGGAGEGERGGGRTG